jgi:hypothetical protein
MKTKSRAPLDQLSTSQKTCASLSPLTCIYHAPFFAYTKTGKRYFVVQGCCNHWDCPRCGILRAKQEYGRMVHGWEMIAKDHTDLWFITITCKGKEMTHDEADEGYLLWTNRLLSVCRADAKKTGQDWIYSAVTERQKRGHPHSHILSTYAPGDLTIGKMWKWQTVKGIRAYVEVDVLRSDWFARRVVSAGLGEQYDISRVRDEKAVSRYVAKYMFKPSAFAADWPTGWKRVRYSNSFPKLPERETSAFVLMKSADWQKLSRLASIITCTDKETYERTNAVMRHYFYGKIKLVQEKSGL